MSDPAQDEAAALVATYSSIFTFNCCGFATMMLLLCEYVATFPAEVDLFWKRRWTGATVLFFVNRYVMLVFTIMDNFNFWIKTAASCGAYIRTLEVMEVLPYMVPWAGFSALRAYAVSSNAFIACLIYLLSFTPAGTNIIRLSPKIAKGIIVPLLGCFEASALNNQETMGIVAASRSSLILADILVIVVTWTSLHKREKGLLERYSLAYVLLRDGTFYFLCLVILNTLHLVLKSLSIAVVPLENTSYMTIFTDPITAVLMSRFMLNLQAVNQRMVDHSTSTSGEIGSQAGNGSLVFERVIGSIGSTCVDEYGPDPHTDDEGTEGGSLQSEPLEGSIEVANDGLGGRVNDSRT